jgi:hypothetical protein
MPSHLGLRLREFGNFREMMLFEDFPDPRGDCADFPRLDLANDELVCRFVNLLKVDRGFARGFEFSVEIFSKITQSVNDVFAVGRHHGVSQNLQLFATPSSQSSVPHLNVAYAYGSNVARSW